MILNEGIIGRSTPRFRRYHEGQFYKFKFKNIKKRIKAFTKKSEHDFFSNKDVHEDTENTKHFKWNDIDGYYDPKGWNPSDWGIEGQELKTILADCSILTQNYILGVENSRIGKWAEFMLHSFMFFMMLSVVIYIVFKFKEFSLLVLAPITGVSLLAFIILKIVQSKRVMTEKEYLKTLKDIADFYNFYTLNVRKLHILTGAEGAYIALSKVNEATQIPHQNFYQAQGVKFDPYNDTLIEEKKPLEEEEPKVINWRDKRVKGDEYAQAQDVQMGGNSNPVPA